MIQCGEIKVRGFHIDIFSHVNNARYLEFMEEARWVVIDKYIDIKKMQAKEIIFVVVNININYRKTASMGDILELYLGLTKIGGKSAVFYQEIRFKGTDTVVADAQVTFVFADKNTGKAVKIDDEIKRLIGKIKI
ncbi:MAG: acyl-CoA thioesterase [Desulfobacteraceae bacterium]|nr:acyl-CoA thioesterase [Desulfobacteraceae bacterium]MDH3572733.1 acyl-CoA thioesterase [Desulfobacteraceae bacterium]MDH3722355.1 acyl-CoA thioesterase [Desulfobacteraceae bacterium]MDH3836977.1 acyl-CoA thioesterase [Desulfobacteraceae bacterium]MDH3874276.1 acyl-CoA thioesterase [Desulfobacteraceae bacterium]